MKTALAMVMALTSMALIGCQSENSGPGGLAQDQGFTLSVPSFETDIKQGELQTVTLSLHRDDYFKQDVKLDIQAADGLTVDPTGLVVKASDKPDVQLRIAAPKEAALGEYRVNVKGTPQSGEPTSADFTVKVVAP